MANTTAQKNRSDMQSARITNKNTSAAQTPEFEDEDEFFEDDEADLILTVTKVPRQATTDQVVIDRTVSNRTTQEMQGPSGLNEHRLSTLRTSTFTFENNPSEHEEIADMTDRTAIETTARSVSTHNNVPGAKYHQALHCWTAPGITQADYEKKAVVSPNHIRDEVITVVCPDSETPFGDSRVYKVNRSALMRSSTLANFFYSPDYLYGCDFTIRFINDPSAAFDVVESYLTLGPDRYTSIRMQSQVTLEYDYGIDRIMIYAKVHLLAKKLVLPVLANMAYEILLESEGLMRASYLPVMATYIFEANGRFDRLIKDWLLKYIGSYFPTLLDNEEWKKLVPSLDPDFIRQWSGMVDANASMLAALDDEPNENVPDRIEELPQQDQDRVVFTFEGENQEKSAMDYLKEVEIDIENEQRQRGNAQGWIDENLSEAARLRGNQVYDDTKARRVLGIIDSSGEPSSSLASAKDKKVGIGASVENSPSKRKTRFYGKRLLKFMDFSSGS